MRLARAAALGMVLASNGCASTTVEVSSPSPTATEVEITLPPGHGVFDYQLGGTYDALDIEGKTVAIDIVARDRTSEPLSGAYSICYVNGFQTQPGELALWEGTGALLVDEAGEPVVDQDWPEERVLDPSTEEQREQILAVVGPQIEECAAKGFDAVELDNLDTWTRFPEISEDGALALAGSYVRVAHALGLAVGQKNAAEIAEIGRDVLGFDFAVTEECAAWDECSDFEDAYGDAVLEIEYPDALDDAGMTWAQVCAGRSAGGPLVLRDRDLVGQDDPQHLYARCGDF